MILSTAEERAIATYKEAANKLPKQSYLLDYALPDFQQTAHKLDTSFDALQEYIRAAEPYVGLLANAALLRQAHYEKFIRTKRVEEAGHRIWREGINQLVVDARKRLSHWKAVGEELFVALIAETPAPPVKIADAIYSELPDPTEVPACPLPLLSTAEKNRRKRFRAQARRRREKEEARVLDAFHISRHEEVNLPVVENLSALTHATPGELLQLLHPIWLFNPTIVINACPEEKKEAVKDLASSFSDTNRAILYFILCKDPEFASFADQESRSSPDMALILCPPVWKTLNKKVDSWTLVEYTAVLLDIVSISLTLATENLNIERNTTTRLYLERCIYDYWNSIKDAVQMAFKDHLVRRICGISTYKLFEASVASMIQQIEGYIEMGTEGAMLASQDRFKLTHDIQQKQEIYLTGKSSKRKELPLSSPEVSLNYLFASFQSQSRRSFGVEGRNAEMSHYEQYKNSGLLVLQYKQNLNIIEFSAELLSVNKVAYLNVSKLSKNEQTLAFGKLPEGRATWITLKGSIDPLPLLQNDHCQIYDRPVINAE